MDEDALGEALARVREYFSGKEVNATTVLAAYLRSYGLPASGQSWENAKQALSQGAGFQQATEWAISQPISSITSASVGMNQLPTPYGGCSLVWFPKQFSQGDIDGVGAKRLLGAPNIDPAWVLVREMGQNSWDARGKSPNIDFVLNLRLLTGPVMETLRKRIFTDDPPKTGLAELLQKDEIWALEVSDRGTVGLGGPIRNDLAVEPGMDTDFIDLVFNIGAPRDAYLGGGTYGFGKTISYVASSVGTILIWSRCQGASGLEHRLIGSAIGDGFNMSGLRYTGRHWWGNVISSEDRVEPAVGDLAEALGETAFATGFDPDGTGTSILILDPQLGGESPEKSADLLARAVVQNLWPKLLAEQSGRSRMNITVQLDGTPIELPSIEQHPRLSGHAQCLLAVRAAQAGSVPEALPLKYPVKMKEIWLKKPVKLLGHLALTRYPMPSRTEQPSHSIAFMRQAELVVQYFERQQLDVEGFQWAGVFKPVADVDDSFALAEPPAHDDWVPQAVQQKSRRREVRVALVRIREAADNYLSPRRPSVTNSEAPPSAAHVGDMLADLLADLEGSAPSTRHAPSGPAGKDSWSSAGDPASGTLITGTTPGTATESSPPPLPDTLHPGDGGPLSSTPTGAKPRQGGSPAWRAGRSKVSVVGVSHVPAQTSGWTRTTLDIQLTNGSSDTATVEVSARVGYDGGSIEDTEVIRMIGWSDESGEIFVFGPAELPRNIVCQFVFEARSDLAIDLQTKLVDH